MKCYCRRVYKTKANPFSLTVGKDTTHISPSQMGGLLSAATAPPLTTGAELKTHTAPTVPTLLVKAHLTTLLAGGCRVRPGDSFLRKIPSADKQG